MNNKLPLLAGLLASSVLCSTSTYALEITETNEHPVIATDVQTPAPTSEANTDKAATASTEATVTKPVSKVEANTAKSDANTKATQDSIASNNTAQASEPASRVHAGAVIYATDNAQVWLRRGAGNQYRLSGTVRAGDELHVISEQNGYIQVRTPAGKTAWILRNETQKDVSFRSAVTSLREENEALKFKLANIDSETARELKSTKEELTALKLEHEQLVKKQGEDSTKLAEVLERNEELEGKLETKEQDMQLRWWKEGGMIAGIGALVGIILVYLPRPRRRRDDYY